MQYVAGAPMLGKGAVLLEEDSAPEDTNSPTIIQKILSSTIGQVSRKIFVFQESNTR